MLPESAPESSIETADRRRVRTDAARLTLADVAGIDRTVARELQQHGFVLPVDIRYASTDELTMAPSVDKTVADRIKSTLVADSA